VENAQDAKFSTAMQPAGDEFYTLSSSTIVNLVAEADFVSLPLTHFKGEGFTFPQFIDSMVATKSQKGSRDPFFTITEEDADRVFGVMFVGGFGFDILVAHDKIHSKMFPPA
jgi:hypothetical protein